MYIKSYTVLSKIVFTHRLMYIMLNSRQGWSDLVTIVGSNSVWLVTNHRMTSGGWRAGHWSIAWFLARCLMTSSVWCSRFIREIEGWHNSITVQFDSGENLFWIIVGVTSGLLRDLFFILLWWSNSPLLSSIKIIPIRFPPSPSSPNPHSSSNSML